MSPNTVKDPSANDQNPMSPDRPLHKVPPRYPPRGRGSSGGVPPTVFPAHMFDQPTSVFVYGPSRPLVNLTLYALATATSPEFQWVEIGARTEKRTPCDPVRLGWVPDDRLWLVEQPDALRPDHGRAILSLSNMIRSDESEEVLKHFTEFLRLPDTSQRILSTRPPPGRPGVVAVTNAERVQGVFSPGLVPSILDVHRRSGFSVIVGFRENASVGRELFDVVLRLQGEDQYIGDWRENELVCEKGVTSGPLRDQSPVRLEEIPLLADVFSRARPAP